MPDIFDQYVKPKTDINPIIYAYSDTRFPGCLKVGYTDRPIDMRMHEHYPTLTPGTSYKIEYVESAMNNDGAIFTDHEVHSALAKRGIKALKSDDGKKTEWYKCSIDDVKAAIIAVKTYSSNYENRTETFGMRPEQKKAVSITKAYFEAEAKKNPGISSKFLWNAKMRFGKTFSAYQLAKAMNMKRILILTFKPAVEESWEADLKSHVDFEGWQFYSKDTALKNGLSPKELDQKRPIVCFGSFQDFLGTSPSGGIKPKNEWVHEINWDLVIFDEYHFGAWRENAKKLFEKANEDSYDELDLEAYQENEAANAINEDFLPITTNHYLFLSGTPFRALNTGEFIEDQIFSWTYSDEQYAKESWNPSDGKNPYAMMPQIVLMTYRIPNDIRKIAYNEDFNEFDLNVFFAAKEELKGDVTTAQFVYKDYVQKWLNLIRGAHMPSAIDDLKLGQKSKPVMPYSDARMLSVLNHTLWFLPNVAACYAMANLLSERQNVFYHDYKINICAGASAGVGLAALEPVRESMIKPLKSKTITISCGKLTTGVTIKPWTGIFMLRNLSSPETYFQAAFRVQSPWTIKNEDGSEEILKTHCYIFDFALDRALKQISDYSCSLNINETNPEKKVGEFVHFLPVLAYDGSTMTAISASDILDITMSGTSATLLAKRWESALLVNVDNDTLSRLLASKEAMDAIMNIEGFRALNKDIETIINKSNAVKKAKKESENLTKKQKKELSETERDYKKKRKQIQDKLIKFATRIPVFMYLTDFREYSLKDVITQLEPGLFKKVTGLSVKDFELLVSIGIFNDSLMNSAVYNFKRYEDASLEYTGINKHSDDKNVGLFSTSLSRDDYIDMAAAQTASMAENPFKKVVVVNNSNASRKRKKTVASKVAVNPGHPAFGLSKEEAFVADNTKDSYTVNDFKEIDLSKLRVGSVVINKKYGEGKISAFKKGKVLVSFSDAVKSFQFPGAFEDGYLTIKE